jgi:hypothetical protein
MIVVVIMHVLALLRTRKDASILTSSIASVYVLYLQWSALDTDLRPECNLYVGSTPNMVWQIVLGFLFTIASLVVYGSTVKSPDEKNIKENGEEDEEHTANTEPILKDQNSKDANQKAVKKN